MDSLCPFVGGTSLFPLVFLLLDDLQREHRGVPALYQSLGGSGEGYPDPSSRPASRVELPKITISVVETSPSEE